MRRAELRADVIVVGAGIVGLSLAWQLRKLGVPRVVLFEAEKPGFKSTGQSSGGIRAQFETRIEIALTQLARRVFYDRLFRDPGFTGQFEAKGYAFLAGESQRSRLRAAWELQRACGVDVEWVEGPALRDRFPYCDTTGLVAGTLSTSDGFVDPWSIIRWLEQACRDQGVELVDHAPVTAIDTRNGRVLGVSAAGHVAKGDAVVIAAGAWSGQVAALAGAAIPVTPSPRMKLVTVPDPALPDSMPLVVDLPTGAYVRSVGGRPMVGVAPRECRTSFDATPNRDLVPGMIETAAKRFPSLKGTRVEQFVSGLYEMTPDGLPVVGAVPEVAGLYVAAGFNGHGVMHGPAVAYALAGELASAPAADFDLDPLAPARFDGASRATGPKHFL